MSGRFEHDWPVIGYKAGYTDLLGVRRAWRGRRLAAALLATAMAAYRADGMDLPSSASTRRTSRARTGSTRASGYAVFHSSTMFSIEL